MGEEVVHSSSQSVGQVAILPGRLPMRAWIVLRLLRLRITMTSEAERRAAILGLVLRRSKSVRTSIAVPAPAISRSLQRTSLATKNRVGSTLRKARERNRHQRRDCASSPLRPWNRESYVENQPDSFSFICCNAGDITGFHPGAQGASAGLRRSALMLF